MLHDREGVTLEVTLPKTKGLIRLGEQRWLHYSRRGDTVKVREVPVRLGRAQNFNLTDPADERALTERIAGGRFHAGFSMTGALPWTPSVRGL